LGGSAEEGCEPGGGGDEFCGLEGGVEEERAEEGPGEAADDAGFADEGLATEVEGGGRAVAGQEADGDDDAADEAAHVAPVVDVGDRKAEDEIDDEDGKRGLEHRLPLAAHVITEAIEVDDGCAEQGEDGAGCACGGGGREGEAGDAAEQAAEEVDGGEAQVAEMAFDDGAEPEEADEVGDEVDGTDVEEHGGKEPPVLALHDMPVGLHAEVAEDAQVGGAVPDAVFEQAVDKGGGEDEEVDGDEGAADARADERDVEGWRGRRTVRARRGAEEVSHWWATDLRATSLRDIFRPE